jgi:hypothetical protein
LYELSLVADQLRKGTEPARHFIIERLAHAAVRIKARTKIRHRLADASVVEAKPLRGVVPKPFLQCDGEMAHERSSRFAVMTEHDDLLALIP